MNARWMTTTALAVARYPSLWPVAITQLWRLRRKKWWATAPFLPVPDAGYLHFRMVTAYGGDGSHPPEPADVVTYLHWCRAWPRVAGS